MFSAKHCLLLLLLTISTIRSEAQDRHNWFFGNKAGILFSKGSAEPMRSNMYAKEGCAVVSDEKGNLVFYSDGISVYNNQHKDITGKETLKGDSNSTQPVVCIPVPGIEHQYFIFTIGSLSKTGSTGLYYSIIEYPTTKADPFLRKNVPLRTDAFDKLTFVPSPNGKDYWIITHQWNSSSFILYNVTGPTLPAPQIEEAGPVLKGNYNHSIGAIKASFDGKKLAMVNRVNNTVELFAFDNLTGKIKSSGATAMLSLPYGIEFSFNGDFLYVASHGNYEGNNSHIYQYPLKEKKHTYKPTLIGSSKSPFLGDLQMGPDMKIYVARYKSTILGVITEPEADGKKSKYKDDGFDLEKGVCLLGFPQTLSHLGWIIKYQGSCENRTHQFYYNPYLKNDSIKWEIRINNKLYIERNNHVDIKYSTPGRIDINLHVYNNGLKAEYKDSIISGIIGEQRYSGKRYLCPKDSVLISPGKFEVISINGESITSAVGLKVMGKYTIKRKIGCNEFIDSLEIINKECPLIMVPRSVKIGERLIIKGLDGEGWKVELKMLDGTAFFSEENYKNNKKVSKITPGTYSIFLENPDKNIFINGFIKVEK